MPTADDLQFKELILSNNLASPQQLEECWETLISYESTGINKPLSSIILDKGYINLKQVNAIRQLQGKNDQYMIRGYTILEILGQGGLGVVYKARQDGIGKIVAIKVMFPNFASNQDYVKRFMREAKVSSELEHENIVKGLDFGECEGLYFFVMEYVEGKSLKSIIQERGPLEEKEALQIMLKIVDALKHAESHNLIHRDIKPENIIITTDGVPKLCDLGLAKTIDENFSLTRTGVVMGTPYYISPEQALAQKDLDIRSDIYSLGVTFYQMLTKQVPYEGESVISIISQHLNSEIPCPKLKNSRLSEEVCKLVYIMMAKKREDRYQNAQALMDDLNCLLRGEAIIAQTSGDAVETLDMTKEVAPLHKAIKKEADIPDSQKMESSGELIEVIEEPVKEKESQKILKQIESQVKQKKQIGWFRKVVYFLLFFTLCFTLFLGYQKKDTILSLLEKKLETNSILDRSSLFYSGDFKEKGILFIDRLKNSTDSLSLFIKEKFSPEMQKKLMEKEPIAEEILIAEMNKIIQDGFLYDKERFADIKLFEEVKELLEQNSSKNGWLERNRMLLENAYQKEIEKKKLLFIVPKYKAGEDAKKEYEIFSERLQKIVSSFSKEEIQKDMIEIPATSLHTEKQEIQAFWIDKYEVSNAQYYEFCKKTGHAFPLDWEKKGWTKNGIPEEEAQYPVTHVSFYDASLYAQYAGKRLPTEIEWEYAAKYSKGNAYPWGQNYQEGYGNINTRKISPVHSFPKGKTSAGIFNMSGNVWEWTSTVFGENQENRIIKGGSFSYPSEYAQSSYRDAFFPHKRRNDLGFRCVFSEK